MISRFACRFALYTFSVNKGLALSISCNKNLEALPRKQLYCTMEQKQPDSCSLLERLREEKKLLRKEIRSQLKKLSPEEFSSQSARVWLKLFELPHYKAAKSVGMFMSMPSGEIHTSEALERMLLHDKKILYVPRVGLNFEHCEMSLVKVDVPVQDATNSSFFENWQRNKWNIPEPPGTVEAGPGDIDVLVVPGCAFDVQGNRIGQGKGYYDRFISRRRLNGKPILIAVGLEPQLLAADNLVPTHEHDIPMDVLVFPHSTIFVNSSIG